MNYYDLIMLIYVIMMQKPKQNCEKYYYQTVYPNEEEKKPHKHNSIDHDSREI